MAIYDVTAKDTALETLPGKVMGGSMIIIPPGVYKPGRALEFAVSGLTIIGAGPGLTVIDTSGVANLTHTWTGYGTFAFRGDHIRLANLTVKCSADPSVPEGQKAVYIGACKNVLVENVQVIGSTWEAIYHDGVGANIRIRGCEVTGHKLSAIDCNNADTVGFEAMDNYIHDGASGIHIIGVNARATGNIIDNCNGYAGIIANLEQFTRQYVKNLLIGGNRITSFGASSKAGRFGIVLTLTATDENIIVKDNFISGMVEAAGYPCYGIWSTGAPAGLILSHNIISDCAGDAGGGIGMSVEAGTLEGNIIRGTGWQYGIICKGGTVWGCEAAGAIAYRDDAGKSALIDCRFTGAMIHGQVYNTDGLFNGTLISKCNRAEL